MAVLGKVKVIFIFLLAANACPDPPTPCDPQLIQRPADPNGYRLRGDRCEGIYVQEVGGSPLFIASWTRSYAEYDPLSREPLRIEWDSVPGADSARLRAQGLRRRLYYRMDTVRPAASKSYKWPTDLLAGLGINKSDLGVVGISRVNAKGEDKEVYLPLRITQGGGPERDGGYRLVLLPGVELKEVFLTLTSSGSGKSTVLKNAEPVGYGYYPADRAVEISIPGVQTKGLCHLEIGATIKTGGAATADLWFYASAK